MLRRFPRAGASAARVLIVVLASLAVAACSQDNATASHDRAVLRVFAAASLLEVVRAAGPAYARATGVVIESSSGASTALRVQIEQGAQADVFLSADERNPNAMAAAGLIDGGPVLFARNRLVIIVPSSNPAGLRNPSDLARPGVKIVAAGENVPISAYAAQLVDQLAAARGGTADFSAAYSANVVSREDDVKAVTAKIELGEGDAAIVYASDAAAARSVLVIPLPSGIEVLATYAGVVPTTAVDPRAGHDFLAWLLGSAGQGILARFGFSAAP